jgi:glucose/arabinose dehydrogenase
MVTLALALTCAAALPRFAGAQGSLPTGFSDLAVIGSLDYPIGMAFLPDGRLLVVEQKSTKIRLVVNGGLASVDPVCAVDGVQTLGYEQGLLGIAVDPGWPARPYLYVHCDNLASPANTIRISRYTVTGDLSFVGNGALSIDVASRYDLINTLPDISSEHNGGTLRFGPDGKLYASIGDDLQGCPAQDDSTLHGVILRLEVNNLPGGAGGPPALGLITPSDNPQVGSSNANTRLIYAYGLRNPYRFQIDQPTGDLYISDVGEVTYEELDRATTGGLNFGWPNYEGPSLYGSSCPAAIPTGPIFWYDRTAQDAAACIAAGVYRSGPFATNAFPASYRGDCFFSDYYAGFLRRIQLNGSTWSLASPELGQPNSTDWGTGFEWVSDYALGADGALWYVKQFTGSTPAAGTGQIRRIVYQGGGGGGGGGTARVSFAAPYPSPAPGFATLPYTLAAEAQVHIVVFDLSGRAVRHLVDADQPAGLHQPTWDGKDDDGREAPSGLYAIRLEAAGEVVGHRLMLVR